MIVLDREQLQELLESVQAYQAALAQRASSDARADATLTAAESVIRARVALYRRLQAQGWTPPDPVRQWLDRDVKLLAEWAGFPEGQDVESQRLEEPGLAGMVPAQPTII